MSSQLTEGNEYEFRCEECAEEIAVNDAMREALLDHGCVVCGAPATERAFTPQS